MENVQVYKFSKVFHCLENGQQFKKFSFHSQTFVHSIDEFYCIGIKDTGNDLKYLKIQIIFQTSTNFNIRDKL